MATVVDNIREHLAGRYFLVMSQGVLVVEGTILTPLNSDQVLLEMWRNGDPDTTTTHIFALADMHWDVFTQTGFVFTQQTA